VSTGTGLSAVSRDSTPEPDPKSLWPRTAHAGKPYYDRYYNRTTTGHGVDNRGARRVGAGRKAYMRHRRRR